MQKLTEDFTRACVDVLQVSEIAVLCLALMLWSCSLGQRGMFVIS